MARSLVHGSDTLPSPSQARVGLLIRAAAITMVLLAGWLTNAPAAQAHGEDETTVGYQLVQQALGHLAHDTSSTGIDLAMEKVDDALSTADQAGVDVPELRQGRAALKAGDANHARILLQDSIKQALDQLPSATGNQTGTTTVTPELSGRSGLHAQDWVFLAASTVVLLLGGWLAYAFRPHDTIRVLRSRLTPTGDAGPGDGAGRS